MKQMYVISLALLSLMALTSYSGNAQEIKKEIIYLLFKENNGKFHHSKGKKFSNEKGLNFNLYTHYFIHKKSHTRDTLCLSDLTAYKLTEEQELKEKEQRWRRVNEDKLKKRYVLYKQLDRNAVFRVFIIEILNNEKMVLYETIFRNEGVID